MSTMWTGPWEPALINGRFYGSFVKKETWTEPSVYFAPTIQTKETESKMWEGGASVDLSELCK